MLNDEEHEGSVDRDGFREAHWHDLDGGGSCGLCSCFVHAQHGLVRHLWEEPVGDNQCYV